MMLNVLVERLKRRSIVQPVGLYQSLQQALCRGAGADRGTADGSAIAAPSPGITVAKATEPIGSP
jgi:hypothetical protein